MSYKSTHPNYAELEVESYKHGHLKLVEPQIEHAKIGIHWIKDAETVQFMGADFSDPSVKKEEERLQKILENTDEYNWMIELNQKIIGNISLNSIQEKSGEFSTKAASFTIIIGDKNYWEKGIGQAVGQKVIEWAFTMADFQVLAARAFEQNTGSIKLLTKLGFHKTGTSPYDGLVNGQSATWINFKLSKI